MSNEDVNQLIASNAKAIEALSAALVAEREERQKAYREWEKDRGQLFQYLGRIASAQSNFYQIQSDYYHQLATLSEKQTELSERQTAIEERQLQMQEQIAQQHSQIIEILNRITSEGRN